MPKLPIGTITFLFTDIEGSTTRWEHHAEEMRMALVRHDELIRMIAEAHSGVVFKTVGDAFYVVFSTAIGGVLAALEAQRALTQEEWPEPIRPFRVRVAVHTGEATRKGHDYFGQTLNRIARILSSGHGGQILLSLTTSGLVRDLLPPDVKLKDLGLHRLKDIQNSERIFQLIAANLMVDFPPLKTLNYRPNNLPTQLTSFVGRHKDVEAVSGLLHQDMVRLITLVGPGGVGKTRLGLQVAADAAEAFPGGMYFIDLSVVQDKDGVVAALAHAIGVREEAHRPLLESIQVHLEDKALLLIDNFEQVLDATSLVREILVKFHQLKVLVTSRSSLHLGGEYEYHVEPLAVPDYRRLPDLTLLAQFESVALFIQQARAVKPDFHLTTANARAVAEICARLDGLPLAIELAAACVKMLSPQAMLKRLGHRLQMLNDGNIERSQRQQTLREAIAWSYNLLTSQEKELFSQLAVFSMSYTLEAVEAVCSLAEDGSVDLLNVLQALINKSLLRRREQDDEEPRFEMLYTIREYASEQLAKEKREVLQRRHAHYYLNLLEQEGFPSIGIQQNRWLQQREVDYENLQAALDWDCEHGQIEDGLRLAEALWYFWWVRGHLREGRRWFEKLLATPQVAKVTPHIRAKALMRTSELACSQRDYTYAETLAEEALKISLQLDDKELISNVYVAAAHVSLQQGAYQRTVSFLEESLKLRKVLGDVRGMASLLNNLGNVARQQENFVRAVTLHRKSLIYFRQVEDEMATAAVLNNLAEVEWCLEHHEQAAKLYEESLNLCRKLGYTWGIASSLVGLADVAHYEKKDEFARSMYKESLVLFQEMDDQNGITACIEGLTEIIRRQYIQETLLNPQAEVVGYSVDSLGEFEKHIEEISQEEIFAQMRILLGEEIFDSLKTATRIDSLEETIADAFNHDF